MQKLAHESGFAYLFKGFSMLTQPGIKRYVFIPLVINIVLFVVLFGVSEHYFIAFLHWLDHKIPSFLEWLNWILWPMFVLACLFVFVYAFVIVANIVSAPFNSFLAEHVEFMLTGKKCNDDSVWDAVKDMPRVLGREMSKLAYYVPRAIVLLILFLIPGINIIATVLWFVFGCWVMCMQYLDYPMDNHKIAFPAMRKYMSARRFHCLSFGLGVVVVLLIPVLNFLVIPAAVIGATMMYCDEAKVSQ